MKHQYARAGALLPLFLSVLVLVGCSGRRSEQVREQGDIYYKNGNLEQAEAEYRKAIEIDPGNMAAYSRLGKILESSDRPEQALENYERAITVQPDHPGPYLAAGKILVSQEDYDALFELASRFKAADLERGTIFEAQIMRTIEGPESAIAVLESLVATMPESVPGRTDLAMIYLSVDRNDEARTQLEAVLDLDPASIPARVLLVNAYRAKGNIDEMMRELHELAAERPDDESISLALAMGHLERGEIDQAREVADPVLQRSADSGWANYVVGCCHLYNKKYDEAQAHLESAYAVLPGQTIIEEKLEIAKNRGIVPARPLTATVPVRATSSPRSSQTNWQQLWTEASLLTLLSQSETILSSGDPESLQILVLSAIFTGRNKLLAELTARLPESTPLAAYANSFLELVDGEKTKEKLESAREALANWHPETDQEKIQHANAEAHLLTFVGLRAQAFQRLAETLRIWPESGVSLRNLAALYESADMPKFVAACMEKLVATHGESREHRQILAQAYRNAGMNRQVRTLAELTYALNPNDSNAMIDLARLYMQDGQADIALQILNRVHQADPKNTILNLILAEAHLRNDNPETALATLDATEVVGELQSTALGLRAFALARKNSWTEVVSVVEEADGEPTVAMNLLRVAGLVHLGRVDEAKETLSTLKDSSVVETSSNLVLRAALQESAPGDTAETHLGIAMQENSSAIVRWAHATSCATAGFHKLAFDLFSAIEDEYDGHAVLVKPIAAVLARSPADISNLDSAEALTKRYPGSAAAWVTLARLQRTAKRQPEEQISALTNALKADPESVPALTMLIALADANGDYELGMKSARTLIALRPDHPGTMNNFAYFTIKTGGDPETALSHARMAFDRLQNNASVLHTLAMAQLGAGKVDEGRRNLEIVLQARPGDPIPTFDYGKLLLDEGQDAEGRQYIEMAVFFARNFKLDFPELDEAEKLLQQTDDQALGDV